VGENENPESISSIADIIREKMPEYAKAKRTAIRYDDGEKYRVLAFDEYLANIRTMACFLAEKAGTQKVVATFCLNRPEWDMTALATLYTGNILFPLDTKMNEVELKHLLSADPPDFLVSSRLQKERISSILLELGIKARLIVTDLYDVFEDRMAAKGMPAEAAPMSAIAKEFGGKELPPAPDIMNDRNTVLAHYATSGTVGLPGIVEITHGNILAELVEGMDIMKLRPNEDFLNIGPYTHIATLVEFLVAKTKGYPVIYFTREADEDNVLEDEIKKLKKQGARIKALMAVPKFWIYIMKEVLEDIRNKKVFRDIYDDLISIEKNAKLYDIGTLDKAKLTATRFFLRDKLGGYFSYGISSSTKLDAGVVEIFAKLGVTVIDIYGATEATGIISRNRLNDNKPGSSGRIISVLQSRFRDLKNIPGIPYPAGELEIKGPTIMKGYLNDAEKTKERMGSDGFMATGDLGYLDRDGYLYLVGRKKELILWKDGSYIDPMRLSNLLCRSIYIKDALVTRLGSDDFLSVFVLPDRERLRKSKDYEEKISTGVAEKQALREFIEAAAVYAQSLAGISAKISTEKIYLLEKKLERTPTHKIKFLFELQRLNLENYI
jgi:long-chain acyl-CoA synthetase